jgi:hypothetical protein
MARSDRDGWPDGCFKCRRQAGILHHISYEPERVVLVCTGCHNKIHSTKAADGSKRYDHLLPELDCENWLERNGYNKNDHVPEKAQIIWSENNVGVTTRSDSA